MVKSPSVNAGFYSWSGTILYAMGQLSPRATATEPVLYSPLTSNYWAHGLQALKPVPKVHAPLQEKPLQWEACSQQGLEISPRSPQLEKTQMQQQRPSSHK